jgi:hypothetical protein
MIKISLKVKITKLASKEILVFSQWFFCCWGEIWYLTKYNKKYKKHSKTIKISLEAKKIKLKVNIFN